MTGSLLPDISGSARGNIGGEQFGCRHVAEAHDKRPMPVRNADFGPFIYGVDRYRAQGSLSYLDGATGGIEDFLDGRGAMTGGCICGFWGKRHGWNMLELNSRSKPFEFHTENNSSQYPAAAMQKDPRDSLKPHERIRPRLKELGWSIAELGRKMGHADEPTYLENLYKYMRGQVDNPRSDMVDEIARAIGLTAEYIRRGEHTNGTAVPRRNKENLRPDVDVETFPPNVAYRTPAEGFTFVRVPMRGQTMGGKDGAIIFSTSDNMGDVLAPPQLFNVPDAYAVQVVGDSMLERFKDGWVVYVNPHRRVVKGDDCVIQIQNDDGPDRLGWIKEFVSMDEKFLKVLQLNPRKVIRFSRKSVVSVHKIIMGGPAG